MRVTRELIEKYHDGKCTPDEEKAVENWLFNDAPESEPALILPTENKAKIQEDMWQEIAPVLSDKQDNQLQFPNPFPAYFLRAAAAVVLISVVAASWYSFSNNGLKSGITVINNASETINKNVNENGFTIAVGPKSNVEINNETGKIDFCGAMMINSKKDIEITIQGICATRGDKSEKMMLKKGQNYIALNYGHAGESNEVIILPEGSMTGLPPMVQRQLMIQFDI